MDERTEMEIVLYGQIIYKGINLPFSFADVLTEPFSEIIDACSGLVDWDFIFPDTDYYLFSQKRKLVNEIHNNLPLMKDADDGAMDYDGSWVYIEDLSEQQADIAGFNCSGFVKWVADGIYFSETGSYMSIASLKEKQLELRGNRWSSRHEDDRDPYFGLDWTRNIAVSIAEKQLGDSFGYKYSDVTDIWWAEYVEDIGFPIEQLKLLMYYLAINEPENIYLVSVSVPWGTDPILQQHVHTAVVIPLIDRNNDFKDIVFERNTESNAELLTEHYPEAHVHLTRVRVSAGFQLPNLENTPDIGTGSYFRR